MAFLRKGKQRSTDDARRDSARAAPSGPSAQYESAPTGPSRMEPALERRWEEAWHRARARSVT